MLVEGEHLLPDPGDVFHPTSNPAWVGHVDAQIFSPPYLNQGISQPVIRLAPPTIGYNQVFSVQSPDAASVSRVTLVRLPSVTHSFDENQRFNGLTLNGVVDTGDPGGGYLQVQAPENSNVCPPGMYMLFILTPYSQGPGGFIPSSAAMIQIAG